MVQQRKRGEDKKAMTLIDEELCLKCGMRGRACKEWAKHRMSEIWYPAEEHHLYDKGPELEAQTECPYYLEQVLLEEKRNGH